MTVKELDGKFYVVKSDGSLGKRGFSTRANAEKAQARGQALAGGGATATAAASADTAAEREALGIPPKAEPKEGDF